MAGRGQNRRKMHQVSKKVCPDCGGYEGHLRSCVHHPDSIPNRGKPRDKT